MHTILLTGATGFVGSHLLKLLVERTDSKIVLLVRGDDERHARQRVKETLSSTLKASPAKAALKRITTFRGDQALNRLGLRGPDYSFLKANLDVIYHCAALAEFRAPIDKLRLANVTGTKNILELALSCKKNVQVSYVSTAFVSGNYKGVFKEDYLDRKQGFNNPYERSKFEAEKLINAYRKKGLNVSVFRPSIVVGEYKTGATTSFKMFYKPFRSVALGYLTTIPLSVNAKLNLIPVDVAAEMIFVLTQNSSTPMNYNIVGPNNIKVTELMDISRRVAGHRLPSFVPFDEFDFKTLTYVQNRIMSEYLCYFNFKTIFSNTKTFRMLKKFGYRPPPVDLNYIKKLFIYARNKGYIPSQSGKVK